MIDFPEGTAVVYCEGAYNTPNGKTAHGLVRFTNRYTVKSVIDSRYAGQDAGMVIDRKDKNIPIFTSLDAVLNEAKKPEYFVVGLAPDGGRLSKEARTDVKKALSAGLHVDCGLHDYLSDDPDLTNLAKKNNVRIRDIRKSPKAADLHFFCGKIEEVKSLKVAVLGTDSAVGKRTTAWLLVHALEKAGLKGNRKENYR